MPVGMITLLGSTHILFGLNIWLVQGGDVCSIPRPVHELAVVDHILLSGVLCGRPRMMMSFHTLICI